SSRRRHTRSDRDWSSDVCSSDLPETDQGRHVFQHEVVVGAGALEASVAGFELNLPAPVAGGVDARPLVDVRGPVQVEAVKLAERSEERRVGKECRSRGWT